MLKTGSSGLFTRQTEKIFDPTPTDVEVKLNSDPTSVERQTIQAVPENNDTRYARITAHKYSVKPLNRKSPLQTRRFAWRIRSAPVAILDTEINESLASTAGLF
jgi:hypothetical protein